MRIPRPILLTALALLPACAQGPDAPSVGPAPTPAGEWALAAIDAEPLPDPLPEGADRPTLRIDPRGNVTGVAGVNRYTARADPTSWPAGEFDLGPIATTRMAGPRAAMDLESRYLLRLDQAETFTATPDALRLAGPEGVLLRFEPAAPGG
jgi:heat shock protein HslJ